MTSPCTTPEAVPARYVATPGHWLLQHLDIPGRAGGPLTGLRVAIKDVIDVGGVATRAGSPAWAESHAVPEQHAPAVQSLLTAGAIVVGKAVSDELAFSVHGTNPHFGTPPNPAAPGHIPGGSSSGSASAVASGDVDFALGTDTGGSVRVPASYCGVLGIRPTWGRTDLAGVVPLSPSFDTIGWFARDAATLLRVGEVLLAETAPSPGVLKLVPLAEAFEVARADVATAVLGGLAARFGGSVTEPRALGVDLHEWAAVRYLIQTYETWQAHGEWGGPRLASLGRGVRQRLEASSRTTTDEYDEARRRRDEIRRILDDRVAADEVLCLPTTPTPAPALDQLDDGAEARRAGVFALGATAGLWGSPEVSVPGVSVGDVPVGTSLVGHPGDDLRLLAFLCSTHP